MNFHMEALSDKDFTDSGIDKKSHNSPAKNGGLATKTLK
jgi:hypothetical protein